MRILDDESDKKMDLVSLLLTRNEANHLIGYLKQLLEKKVDHCHLMSEDFNKEIMVCLYDQEGPNNYSPRIQKLIKDDE